MIKYEISMVDHAWINCANSVLFKGGKPDERTRIECYSYILRDTESGDVVLVDTGVRDMDVLNSTVTAGGKWERVQDLLEVLQGMQISPEDVSAVVLTHCHYDHASYAGAFENAELVIGSRDIDFLYDKEKNGQYEKLAGLRKVVEEKKQNGRLIAVDDEFEYKGLCIVHAGGHTPGSQMVEANTQLGKCLLTGDAVFLVSFAKQGIPIGMSASPDEAEKAALYCKSFNGMLLTGHDKDIKQIFS